MCQRVIYLAARLSYSIHALGNMMSQSMRDFLRLIGYMAVATLIILTANALAVAAVMTGLWVITIMG